jgi:DNA-directed RNA polymerase specialized sigma24 family protein
VHVPLEEVEARDERDFEREWMLNLLKVAMKSLAAGTEAVRRDLEVFRAFVRDRKSYEALSEEFGIPAVRVKNAIYETKQRLRREVGKCVNTYTRSAAEFDEEMSSFESSAL